VAKLAVEHRLPLAVVCRVLGASRSTVYARRIGAAGPRGRPGPVTSISDDELVGLTRRVLADSPFAGEGYCKVRARLRRERGV
jgi:putative transposase